LGQPGSVISQQAVPLVSQPPSWHRLHQHLVLTAVVGAVAVASLPSVGTVVPEPQLITAQPAGVPASPSLEWIPVRVPIFTRVTPVLSPAELAMAQASASPDATLPTQPELAAVGQEQLTALPDSFVESPVTMVSNRPLTLWSDDQADAGELGRVPRLARLEAVGPARDGRIPVRLELPEGVNPVVAWVDAAALTATGQLGIASPWARPFAFGLQTVGLTVPYRTQLDGSAAAGANCGPASLGMIFDSYGISAPTATLRARAHGFQGTAGPDTGFLLEVLQKVAESYGLEGQDLLENGRYRRWTLDDVRRHLRAGHPVVPQLRYRLMPGREWAGVNYDHYLVLTGVDGEDFLFNDPIPWSGKGQGRITAAQLLRAWSNSDAPMAALAIADPR
jgi:hypothetical protein